jgi:hypothetical protein
LLTESIAHLLTIQFGISNSGDANRIAKEFFDAYYKFAMMPQSSSQSEYLLDVQPLLIKAYKSLKETIDANWDPDRVAAADLSWWVARRQDNMLSPEIVGEKIGEFYKQIYGEGNQQFFARAAYLRAVSARYRDLCQDQWGGVSENDWRAIQSLLGQSYFYLEQGKRSANDPL